MNDFDVFVMMKMSARSSEALTISRGENDAAVCLSVICVGVSMFGMKE